MMMMTRGENVYSTYADTMVIIIEAQTPEPCYTSRAFDMMQQFGDSSQLFELVSSEVRFTCRAVT